MSKSNDVENLGWKPVNKLKNFSKGKVILARDNFTYFNAYTITIKNGEIILQNGGTAFLHNDEVFLLLTSKLVTRFINHSLTLKRGKLGDMKDCVKNLYFTNFINGFIDGYRMKKESENKLINQPKEKDDK